mgnify:CR=1 FL=1
MFCILYAAVIVIFGLAIFLLPKNRILVRENRVRADFPALSVESLLDKSFFRDFSEFCSDSFPLRERLLALNSSLELGFGKLESNGVMKGKNQNLIKRHEYNDFERLKSSAENYGITILDGTTVRLYKGDEFVSLTGNYYYYDYSYGSGSSSSGGSSSGGSSSEGGGSAPT